MLDTQGSRCVALRVIIDDEDVQAGFCERGSKVDSSAGLSNATLLIRHGKDTRMHRLGE